LSDRKVLFKDLPKDEKQAKETSLFRSIEDVLDLPHGVVKSSVISLTFKDGFLN